MFVVAVVAVRLLGGPFRSMAPYADLFFLGVAFLLLETKSVVQFALLFGTTWLVNALVFIGVLLSVLLAITVSKRVRLRSPLLLYPVLFASLLLGWLSLAARCSTLDRPTLLRRGHTGLPPRSSRPT